MAALMDDIAGFGRTQNALLRLLLRNKSGLTVDRIAEGLGVTRTAVNQHLSSLERDGYVRRSDDAVMTGGRPSRLYALSERGVHLFPKNYDLFSLKTLEALIDAIGPDKAGRVLDRLGRRLGSALSAQLHTRKLRDKIPAITAALQELGFDAEIAEDAPKQGPAIRAYNCVYHSLARANPEVCRVDLAFLREASGAEIDHTACMAKGDNECTFHFRQPRNPNAKPV